MFTSETVVANAAKIIIAVVIAFNKMFQVFIV